MRSVLSCFDKSHGLYAQHRCAWPVYLLWLCMLFVVLGPMQGTASAIDFTRLSAPTGNFGTINRWSPCCTLGPPDDNTDVAIFTLTHTVPIGMFTDYTNKRLEVHRTLTLALNTNTYTLDPGITAAAFVGLTSGTVADVTLQNGNVDVVGSLGTLQIGRDVGSDGKLTLDLLTWTSPANTLVGVNGTGELLLTGFSSVLNNATGILGLNTGSSGTATVFGQFAQWSNTGDLLIGRAGIGDLTIDGGFVQNGGEGNIAQLAGSTGTVEVSNGGTWSNNDTLYVGGSSSGAGGTGSLTLTSAVTNLVTVSNDMTVWPTGTVTIFGGKLDVGGQFIAPAGAAVGIVGGTLEVGSLNTPSGLLNFSFGTLKVTASDVTIGVGESLGMNLQIGNGKTLIAAAALNVGTDDAGDMTVIGGGTVTSNMGVVGTTNITPTDSQVIVTGSTSSWTMTGDLEVRGTGTTGLNVDAAATLSNQNARVADVVGTTAKIHLTGGGMWNSAGSVYLGGDAVLSGGSGTLDVDSGAAMNVTATTKVWDNFIVSVNGGTITTPTLEVLGTVNYVGTLDLSGGGGIGSLVLAGGTVSADVIDFANLSFSGFGALNGVVKVGGDVTATGNLTLGNANSFAGVTIGGGLDVGTHTVTINKNGFFTIGTSTVITGGMLVVPNGVAIPLGAGLNVRGTINGRIVQQAGSSIAATGNLTLGDAGSAAGFFSDGEMTVDSKNQITLLDANEAVLGSLTTLGGGGLFGDVTAANGAVLEFGKNIIGFGTVDTPNDPFKPLINNGSVAGSSALEPITLTGYVKGVGTLDNVVITGTDAPGFSAATVYRGSVTYAGELEIEIGGLTAGAFDIINHSGTATLGGTLDLSLLNGFTPGLGDTFQFITAASRIGEFVSVLGLDLGGGLAFDVLYGVGDVTLQVISTTLPGDFDIDGDVDGFDFLQWQRGESPNPLSAADLAEWEANYGTVASLSATSSAVPEPTTAIMLTLGMAAVLIRRQLFVS